MSSFRRYFILALTVPCAALAAGGTAEAKCTRLAFSVNDFGKDGPTKDAKALLDKYIAEWTAQRGIKKYTTGKKDVSCELFLDVGVFDEHTCKAEASVCWDDGGGAPRQAAPAAALPQAAPVIKPAQAVPAVKPAEAAPVVKPAPLPVTIQPPVITAPVVKPVTVPPTAAPVTTGTVPAPDTASQVSPAPKLVKPPSSVPPSTVVPESSGAPKTQ